MQEVKSDCDGRLLATLFPNRPAESNFDFKSDISTVNVAGEDKSWAAQTFAYEAKHYILLFPLGGARKRSLSVSTQGFQDAKC
jgi:hypothetical protein